MRPNFSLDPIWTPDDEIISRSNIAASMRNLSMSFEELYRLSRNEPAEFWSHVLEVLQIRFARPPSEIYQRSPGHFEPHWLAGSKLNIVESCFQAPPSHPAIIEVDKDGQMVIATYEKLSKEMCIVAHGLRNLDMRQGDAIALFMPMTLRSVAIYLGAILAGCVVVAIADSLAREQALLRLRIGNPRLIFTCDCLYRDGKKIPLGERVMGAGVPLVMTDDNESRRSVTNTDAMSWEEFVGSDALADAAYAHPETPINVLFSSGTTSEPKAIPWDQTTPIRAAVDGYFHQDIHPRDVVAWPTNFGWMMGPWLTFCDAH